jgi:hypothetical protein
MSYQSQAQLANDPDFQHRIRACLVQQSDSFKNDGRADIAALAADLLRADGAGTVTFYGMVAAAPGFADMADAGAGGIDSSRIGDPDILAAVQAAYPTVAALYFDPEGNPKP